MSNFSSKTDNTANFDPITDQDFDAFSPNLKSQFSPLPTNAILTNAHNANFEILRVVLADDAVDLRRLLARLLSKDRRIEIIGEAEDGITAIRLCLELQPDVLVLDLSMPGSDGLNTLEAVRSNSSTAVVILSGLPRSQLEQSCIERGAFSYLEKGVSTSSIISTVIAAGDSR